MELDSFQLSLSLMAKLCPLLGIIWGHVGSQLGCRFKAELDDGAEYKGDSNSADFAARLKKVSRHCGHQIHISATLKKISL